VWIAGTIASSGVRRNRRPIRESWHGFAHMSRTSLSIPSFLGELRFGILILPKGRKRTALARWFNTGVGRLHYLPWDPDTGLKWAELLAQLRTTGKAMPVKDSLIATTAVVHGGGRHAKPC
jgi:predicted nucleic acid-binding protein